jgi:hypothetical protein
MVAVVDELAVRGNSVNDLVREQITALMNNNYMSAEDRQRLQRHFDGIRDASGLTALIAGGLAFLLSANAVLWIGMRRWSVAAILGGLAIPFFLAATIERALRGA